MYNFLDFCSEIIEQVRTAFPQYEVNVREVEKSRKTTKGLVVRKPDSAVAPSIKIDEFFEQYQEGRAIKYIVEDIRKIIERTFNDGSIASIEDKTKVAMNDWRNTVRFALIMTEGNDKYIAARPHMPFLDMTKVYAIVVDDLVEGHTSRVWVTNEQMECMGCTLDELDAHAMANTLQQEPMTINSIEEVLREMLGEGNYGVDPDELFSEPTFPMYVVSNRTKCDGATVIAYPETREKICDVVGEDEYVVLPSSRHEVLVIPKSFCCKDMDALRRMVHEVNETQVPPEDLLSENVYYYTRGGELEILKPAEPVAESGDIEYDVAQ